MLIAIHESTRDRFDAELVDKSDGPFCCPVCEEQVCIKKGTVKTHHFAHYPNSTCQWGTGETEIHRRTKKLIYRDLQIHGGFSLLEMEYNLGTMIPDVYVEYKDGLKVAFEVQHSSISPESLEDKARFYSLNEIYVLWVVPFREALREERYSPTVWERWLHRFYYGRVYYFEDPCFFIPVHFGEEMLRKEGGYNSDGEEFPGYSYYSKRYRVPCFGNHLLLTRDFKRHNKGPSSEWEPIPNALILRDRKTKWW